MTRTITGLFDTRGAAEAVISHLVTHDGVDRSRITLHGNGDTAMDNPGTDGFWASLKNLFVPDEDRYAYTEGLRRGSYLLAAELEEGQVTHAMDVFEEHGAVDLDAREQEWRSSGWQGYQPDTGTTAGTTTTTGGATTALGAGMAAGTGIGAAAGTGRDARPGSTAAAETSQFKDSQLGAGTTTGTATDTGTGTGTTKGPGLGIAGSGLGTAPGGGTSGSGMAATGNGRTGEEGVIPVVQETLRVGKRDTEQGRVRVRAYVIETPVTEQVSLREEHVDVQRRVVDRPLSDADSAFREQTIEAVEHREEPVVSKEARVVEEVVINKEATEHIETVEGTVRRQEVKVEDTRDTAGKTGTPLPDKLPDNKV